MAWKSKREGQDSRFLFLTFLCHCGHLPCPLQNQHHQLYLLHRSMDGFMFTEAAILLLHKSRYPGKLSGHRGLYFICYWNATVRRSFRPLIIHRRYHCSKQNGASFPFVIKKELIWSVISLVSQHPETWDTWSHPRVMIMHAKTVFVKGALLLI